MAMCVIVAGNPLTGLEVFGPYTTEDDAMAVVERWDDTDWWIAPLEAFVDTQYEADAR